MPNNARQPEGVLARYRHYLPIEDEMQTITLGEGDTPLAQSHNIARRLGCDLYFKLEGCNPTGSFKDRGMVVAISHALLRGARYTICASTGNTSASAAAYSARFGLQSLIFIPDGKIAMGKLLQGTMYGGTIVKVQGSFDHALALVNQVLQSADHRDTVAMVNSSNPYRLYGQRTAAFEIIDALGTAPDLHCIPVGNAGNITAYWAGYRQYHELKRTANLPQMHGFQASGAAPIVRGEVVDDPQTFATAIRIGNPVSWQSAARAADESGGSITAHTDERIRDAYLMLAREEGIFCEPASAISLAGLLQMHADGYPLRGKTVVCTLTGNGLKDPTSGETYAEPQVITLDPHQPVAEQLFT